MDVNTLKKVAHLARLELSEEQIEEFHDQFRQVLAYVDQLSQLDTEEIKPIYFTNSDQSVLRSDVVEASLSNEQALANSDRTRDGQFRVPQVVDQG